MGFLSQFDAYHELAAKAAGMNDFGATDYVAPMRMLLSDYDNNSHFDQTGEQMIGAGIVGLLVGRLFAQQGFKSYPKVDVSVEKPIVLAGMMRTGSTALHRLLAKDPANQWLPPWLAATPMPRPQRETWESNPCYQGMAQGFAQLYQMNPNIKQAHPMAAGEPDECRFAMDQSFWSPAMAATAVVPEYTAWCMNCDSRYAYRYYRKVLELIANGSDRRWVLKNPCYLWGIDSLIDEFPDACIVVTHRDLKTSIPSTASLTYELRRLREPDLTPEQSCRESIAHCGNALDKMEKIRARHDPSLFFDVHIDQIESDPVGTVESIYRYFDLPVSELSRAVLRQAAGTRAGASARRYTMQDFGLTERDAYAGAGQYYDRYRTLYGETT